MRTAASPSGWLSPWLERLDGVSPAPVDAGEQQIDVEVVLPQPAVLTTS